MVSKVCALSIITLVLIPFTAPFKTYELSGSRSDHAHDGLPKDKIDSDEKLVDLSGDSLTAPALNIFPVEPPTRPKQIGERQLQTTILRI